MGFFDRLTDRVLALVGLDLDFTLPTAEDERVSAISEDLWLGARPRPDHLPWLQDHGITHVVSCLEGPDDVAFLTPHVETLFLPLRDVIHEDIARTFPEFFAFVDEARRDPRARLLVHCEVGVSRSASLVIALRMRAERERFLEAFEAVRRRRPKILPNIGFAAQLQRLERELLGEARPGERSSLGRYLRTFCNVPVEEELLEDMLTRHDHDAFGAIQALFGEDIPRVIQGMRL